MYDKVVNPFYKSRKWKRKRETTLRHYDYECQEARQYGKTEQAETVHHIYPLEEYPELALVGWNLLPITNKAHNTFHDRTNDKVIGRGIYWQNKRRNDFEKFYGAPPKNNF